MAVAERTELETIRTKRLVLTPVRAAHAAALYPLIDDWEVVKMLAQVPWPVTLAGVQAFTAGKERPGSGESAFTLLAEGAPIGVGSVKHPGSGDEPRVMPRLGYWIGRPFWGLGYGTETVAALTGFAFRRFGDAEVIGAGVFHDNPASRRILEKAGFRQAGGYDTPCLSRGRPVPISNMLLARAEWEAFGEGSA